jgi:hypothetical protein
MQINVIKSPLLILSILCLSFRTGDYFLIKSIPIHASFLTTDQFSNCYIISDNQLLEYDSLGKYLANYSDKTLGSLTSIDASNPMKVELFYRDLRQVVMLDNKLAFTTSINFIDLDIQQPLVICNSYNDALWVYDQQDFQLKRIESTLQITQQSGNITQVLGYDLKPTSMIEDNKWLYMNNPETGILVFDYYGSYYKTIPILNIISFQIIDNKLVYYKENSFVSYDMHSFQDKLISMPKPLSMLIYPRLEKQRIFLLEQNNLEISSF